MEFVRDGAVCGVVFGLVIRFMFSFRTVRNRRTTSR